MINNRQAGRRRGRGGQRSQGGNPGRGPENGNRIDNRARGNAAQLHEKYKTLARDAQMQGDRVNTEYYLQFADHYFRVLAETRSRFEENQPRRGQNDQDYGDEDDDFDGNGEPMADDRVDQYVPDRGNDRVARDGNRDNGGRDNGNRDGNGRDNVSRDGGNRDNGNRDNGNREGGREAGRDQNRDGNRDGNRDANRDPGRNRPAARVNGRDGNGYAAEGNANRVNGQRDAAADRAPRRFDNEDGYDAADEEQRVATPAPVAEVDRPRRGRPRRVTTPVADTADTHGDAGEDVAAIVDRLPPALSLSASSDDAPEEKPRRRRGRPPASEVTPVS